MTDEERDLIDNGVEEFINQCSELINKVKNTLSSTKGDPIASICIILHHMQNSILQYLVVNNVVNIGKLWSNHYRTI